MPKLEFYAAGADHRAVLDAVHELDLFRVFEDYSEPGSDLREFLSPEEVPSGGAGVGLMLYPIGAGPEPVAQRIELRPGPAFRYRCIGWGLIQLRLESPDTENIWRSYTNHNTEKRAHRWADVTPDEAGNPSDWDWTAVTSASSTLNRAIRKLGVSMRGPYPVLPHAAELIAGGLGYER
jgi:hypothetical protein